MNSTRAISIDEARRVGAALKIDWSLIDLEQFRRGIEVEFEHGSRDPETNVTNDDLVLTAKIAWGHLKGIRDYYTRLERLEADAATATAVAPANGARRITNHFADRDRHAARRGGRSVEDHSIVPLLRLIDDKAATDAWDDDGGTTSAPPMRV